MLGRGESQPRAQRRKENYSRKAVAYLPRLKIRGAKDPVVQVIDQGDGEIVYTLRIKGDSFRPKVFKSGKYTVKVGELGTDGVKTLKNVQSLTSTQEGALNVTF